MGKEIRATKEERFMLEAYRQACLKASEENPQEAILHRYRIGEKVGMAERGVNASFKLFVKSNFVESLEDAEFSLSADGIRLAKLLLSEHDNV